MDNAAHFRFFNAFSDRVDVRAYVQDHLYETGGVGPAVGYGNRLEYDDVPSGTVDVTAGPYGSLNTVWASLADRSFVEGRRYTVVGTTNGSTRTLYLFGDGVTATDGAAYFRVINASTANTPIYVILRRDSDDVVVYQSGTATALTIGNSTGYRAVAEDDEETYTLNVYGSSDFSNSLSGDVSVTLRNGTPLSMVVYDRASGSGQVSVRVGEDD